MDAESSDSELQGFIADLLEAPGPADWRCMDPDHAAPCALCSAAPAASAEAHYLLVGATAADNGVKTLRRLLCCTPEWRDAAARRATADAWAASGDAALQGLAPAVRAGAASELRRAHLLALCRRWRLGSNLWQRRGSKRAAPATADAPPLPLALPAAAQPLAPAPQFSMFAPSSAAAFGAWLRTLLPQLLAVNGTGTGERARAAALATRHASHCAPAHAAEFRWVAATCADVGAVLRAHADAARRWRSAASACASGAAPAWASLPPEGCGLEALARTADRTFLAALPALPPDAPRAELVASQELRDGMVLGGDLDARVLAALEHMKAAPLVEYLAALAGALLVTSLTCAASCLSPPPAEVNDGWEEAMQDMMVQYTARAAWMDDLWAAHGGGGDGWSVAPRPLLFSMSGAARLLQSHVDATQAAAMRMEAAAAVTLAGAGAAPALAAAAAW